MDAATGIVIVIVWVVPIFVAVSQGRAKGRDGWVYGILLGWIGVLILAVLPPVEHGKPCPECAEIVHPNARVCRFCGHRFDEAPAATR